MAKKAQFFPQISRKIPARWRKLQLHWLIFSLLALFFLLNLWGANTLTDPLKTLKIFLFQNYQNPAPHLKLTEIYLNNNDLKNAQREISLAEGLLKANHPREKAEVEKLRKIVVDKIAGAGQIRQEIEGWEKISQDFPGYRDAYLQLAKLYYEIYEDDRARENLVKALELDPNFPPAKEFQKILGE